MMKPINSLIRGLVPGLLFGLLSTTTVAVGAETPLDRVVAIVEDDIILETELQRRSDIIRQQVAKRNTRLPDNNTFIRQVLSKMIIERIQMQKAAERGIVVSDAELNGTLDRIAESNGLTLPEFKAQLEQEGQNYLEVREQIRTEMLLARVQERVVNQRVQVTEQEVKNFLASEQGQKSAEVQLNLSHIMIPVPNGATSEQLIAATRHAREVYQQLLNGEDFGQMAIAVSKSPEALKGGEIGWRKPSELPEAAAEALASLDKGEMTEPFRVGGGFHILKINNKRGGQKQMIDQAQVRHILIKPNQIRSAEESELQIQELFRRLNRGEDFAILAKQFSDDPGSGSKGGDLGWVMDGQMVPEFESTMHATATGEISPPFQSQFGWHILQVTNRRQQDFGKQMIENEAYQTLRKRKYSEGLSNWLREIHAQAYIETKL
ncbi:molecular chaperone SurA [Motiliproteus coralliicola]|uniref:Chaperone SurA n=1 Tax=Motiliproteus coralliicola TaxID=2283196 RepID=A0A369WGX0_9GAMM|nr:peptidylprolyl isomerase [Motiliproteus coralliicola]RDE19866.1 molecular chaperone SurA [Motiliproteus coralliicola]